MTRILTALVALPPVVAAIFFLPGSWFLVLVLAVGAVLAWELAQLAEKRAPGGPYWALMLLVPVAVLLMVVLAQRSGADPVAVALAVPLLLSVGVGMIVVISRVPMTQAAEILGLLSFGTAYLAVPMVSVAHLRSLDPWLLILVLAVAWGGDTGAFYCGRALGRHKMAPVISPNKTWEGAAGGFAAALAAAALWSLVCWEAVSWTLLAAAAVTAVGAQVGDLLESVLKRSAGIKDSSRMLPGHGGLLDRLDAVLFAAPILTLILLVVGVERLRP